MQDDRQGGLLGWQWSQYPSGHRDRTNLMLHIVTVPLFVAGSVATVIGWSFHPGAGGAGILAMLVAVAVQGRGHRRETAAPAPFRGPLDFVGRIVLEQLITFPRYVLSGEFGRAWREGRRTPRAKELA